MWGVLRCSILEDVVAKQKGQLMALILCPWQNRWPSELKSFQLCPLVHPTEAAEHQHLIWEAHSHRCCGSARISHHRRPNPSCRFSRMASHRVQMFLIGLCITLFHGPVGFECILWFKSLSCETAPELHSESHNWTLISCSGLQTGGVGGGSF